MKKIIAFLMAVIFIFSAFTFNAYALGKKEQLPDGWKEMVLKNYNEFISEVDGDPNKIPMIVSTDQHGAIKSDSEVYTYINEITDWSKISKIINLGDTVDPIFNPFQLINYRIATKCLPKEKRIEVIGNHDRFFVPFGKLVDILFFPTPNAARSPMRDTFVVKDEQFNVRYLAVDTKFFPWNYHDGYLFSSQADFIIKELEKNDSSDIVMLSHPYLFRDEMIRRDGTTFTGSEYFIGGPEKFADVKQSFVDMLSARKNKTSGVLIDCRGKEHPYDFSKCESDFIMALHGHHHTEGYETKGGVTEFLFQSFTKDNADNTEPFCFYFAYIDREKNTFKCWKNFAGYDAWEIEIA